jgi:hypothetical protein
MEPFTEYYRLLAFARRADGSFGYYWYGNRFVEEISYEGVKRTYTCVSVKKGENYANANCA